MNTATFSFKLAQPYLPYSILQLLENKQFFILKICIQHLAQNVNTEQNETNLRSFNKVTAKVQGMRFCGVTKHGGFAWHSYGLLSFDLSCNHLKKWAIPDLFFFIFVFSRQLTVSIQYKFLPMTGLDPQTSGIRSNRSTKWATTTAPSIVIIIPRYCATLNKGPTSFQWSCLDFALKVLDGY